MTDAAKLLDMIRDRAPGLRTAGVEHVEVRGDGTLVARLRPPDPPPPDPPAADEATRSALDDEDTFGGDVPKRTPMLYRDDEEQQS